MTLTPIAESLAVEYYCVEFLIHCGSKSFICILTRTFQHHRYLAVTQAVRSFAPQAEGSVLESQPRQTYVVKTGFNSCILLADDLYERMSRVTVSIAR